MISNYHEKSFFKEKEELNILGELLNEYENPEDLFYNLTLEKAKKYGFLNYEEDLYLIPYYLREFIPVGINLHSIDNSMIKYNGENISDDTRFGMLGYGLKIKET